VAIIRYPPGWNMPMATKRVMMAAKVVPMANKIQRHRCRMSQLETPALRHPLGDDALDSIFRTDRT
jgi:hypothetical protein